MDKRLASWFSIKGKRVNIVTRSRRWRNVGRDEMPTLKKNGLGEFFIVTGGMDVCASPTSWTFVVGPLDDMGTCVLCCLHLPRALPHPHYLSIAKWPSASRPLSFQPSKGTSVLVPASSSSRGTVAAWTLLARGYPRHPLLFLLLKIFFGEAGSSTVIGKQRPPRASEEEGRTTIC